MGEAPESSDMPAASSSQHGDAATLDVFAELERAGVPAKKAEKSGSKSKTTTQSGTASQQQGGDAPADKDERSEQQPEPEVKAAPATAVAPSTALLFQPPDHASARRPRRASAPAGPPPSAAEDSGTGDTAETEKLSPSAKASSGRQQNKNGKNAQQDAQRQESSRQDSAHQDSARRDSDSDSGSGESEAKNDSDGNEEGGQRRRRRRGGRGRRGRGGSNNNDSDSTSDKSEDEKSDKSANGKSTGKQDSKSNGGGQKSDEKADRSNKGEDKSAPASDAEQGSSGPDSDDDGDNGSSSSRRRRRRRRGGSSARPENSRDDEVATPRGSTRLEAKRQRRREGRETGRRKPVITEAEFLARRESVNRTMMVRERDSRMQIAVLEDDVLVEHYVSRNEDASIAGNVYVGKVQNVLPSMEAAFVDIGKGRNAVLYAGEVNWDAAGLEANEPRRIESALTSGDHVLVQVTKDPIGHKGARLTAQISLAGRFLVFVPNGSMTGISRKLPDTERNRLKKILKDIVPEGGGVIVRTAAEGASEDELRSDIQRLQKRWQDIEASQKGIKKSAGPKLVHSEADMAIRVVRDILNEDFEKLVVSGDEAWGQISNYVEQVAPDLSTKLSQLASNEDIFAAHRIDEQLAKAMDRKVYLPSGGSLVIDRTEAMTVVDVNTGRFTGTGGTLEETVTKNNLEAAEEVVRQLRLRDIGGIIVIDFIDMVLEQNRDLVMRRLVECLGRDRTKHQVAEVTSLGLVQMTRKRVGQGLVEAFSEKCEHCGGRGFITHAEPVEKGKSDSNAGEKSGDSKAGSDTKRGGGRANTDNGRRSNRRRKKDPSDSDSGKGTGSNSNQANDAGSEKPDGTAAKPEEDTASPSETPEEVRAALAAIAAAAVQSHERKTAEDSEESKGESKAGAPKPAEGAAESQEEAAKPKAAESGESETSDEPEAPANSGEDSKENPTP